MLPTWYRRLLDEDRHRHRKINHVLSKLSKTIHMIALAGRHSIFIVSSKAVRCQQISFLCFSIQYANTFFHTGPKNLQLSHGHPEMNRKVSKSYLISLASKANLVLISSLATRQKYQRFRIPIIQDEYPTESRQVPGKAITILSSPVR